MDSANEVQALHQDANPPEYERGKAVSTAATADATDAEQSTAVRDKAISVNFVNKLCKLELVSRRPKKWQLVPGHLYDKEVVKDLLKLSDISSKTFDELREYLTTMVDELGMCNKPLKDHGYFDGGRVSMRRDSDPTTQYITVSPRNYEAAQTMLRSEPAANLAFSFMVSDKKHIVEWGVRGEKRVVRRDGRNVIVDACEEKEHDGKRCVLQ